MRTVIRPAWSGPNTDAQRDALAKAVRLARQLERVEAEMWQAILEARQLDVPDTVLMEATKQSRATLHRRYGPRSAPRH